MLFAEGCTFDGVVCKMNVLGSGFFFSFRGFLRIDISRKSPFPFHWMLNYKLRIFKFIKKLIISRCSRSDIFCQRPHLIIFFPQPPFSTHIFFSTLFQSSKIYYIIFEIIKIDAQLDYGRDCICADLCCLPKTLKESETGFHPETLFLELVGCGTL